MLRSAILGLALASTVCCATMPSKAADGNAPAIADYLQRSGALDDTFSSIMKDAVSPLVKVLPWKTIEINARYSENSIHIYVVKTLFNEQSFAPGPLRRLALESRDNFVAIGPNVILVDRAALVKLLQTALEWLAAGRAGNLLQLLTVDDTSKSHANREAVDQIAGDLAALVSRRIMTERHSLMSDQKSIEFFEQEIAADYAAAPKARTAMYTAALAPVLLHEAAHLIRNQTGNFADAFWRQVTKLLTADQRQQEDEADAQAAQLFNRYMQTQDAPALKAVGALGLRAYTDYLTSEIWAAAYDGFRGTSFGQFFWNFDRSECTSWASELAAMRQKWARIAPSQGYGADDEWVLRLLTLAPKSREEQNLENPMLVLNAGYDDLPLLTAEEFDSITTRANSVFGDGSHAPHFIRASRLADMMASLYQPVLDSIYPNAPAAPPKDRPDIVRAQALLDALERHDALKIAPLLALGQQSALAATVDRVRRDFGEIYEFRPAINCPADRCLVGTLKSKRNGFIELVNGKAGLARIRVAAQYAQPGDDRAFQGDAYERRVKELFPYMFIIGTLGDAAIDLGWITEAQSAESVTPAVTSIRKQMAECKLPFLHFSIGKMLITIEAKEDNWIFATAWPTQ